MNERILQIVIQPNPNNCSASIKTNYKTVYIHAETLDEIWLKIKAFENNLLTIS